MVVIHNDGSGETKRAGPFAISAQGDLIATTVRMSGKALPHDRITVAVQGTHQQLLGTGEVVVGPQEVHWFIKAGRIAVGAIMILIIVLAVT